MSFYPAENLGFFDTVQAYFLERTGRGLVLSSRDLELLIQWQCDGATVAAVCRGIDEAIENLNRPPKDIYACRRHVEKFVEQNRENLAGAHGLGRISPSVRQAPVAASKPAEAPREEKEAPAIDPLAQQALEALENASKSCARSTFREAYLEAHRQVDEAARAPGDVFARLAEIEDALTDAMFDALDPEERREIDASILKSGGGHLERMSEEARRETLRERRRRVLNQNYGLISLI